MSRFSIILILLAAVSLGGCSYRHPVVGIFPTEDDEDSNSLFLLLAGLGLGAAILEGGAQCVVPSGTVLIAGQNQGNGRLALFRCNRDGTGCVHIDASAAAGQGDNTGLEPNIVFDPVNNRVIVTARNSANNDRLGYYRCNPDGTGCAYSDLATGADSGHTPFAGIDLVNNRLVVAARDSTSGTLLLSLNICNLDGTACARTDVSTATGQGNFSGFFPSLVVDNIDQRLYMATANNGASSTVGYFRCNLNATGCTFTNVSVAAGLGANSGLQPSLIHDQANGRNVFIARDNGLVALSGVRCQEDGTGCVSLDVTAGQPVSSSKSILAPNNRIYTVSHNTNNNSRASLWRCDIDGTNCMHANIGAALGNQSGFAANVAADNSCAYATSRNAGGADELLYYYCGLDGTGCQTVDLTAATGTGFGVTGTDILLL